VQALLAKGADVNAKSNAGKTALDYTTTSEHAEASALAEVRALLLQAGDPSITRSNSTLQTTVLQTPVSHVAPLDTQARKEQGAGVYTDSKWGFAIRHPGDWSVARGEHVEGEWTKPVVLVKSENGERVACIIVSIGALHNGCTITHYMNKAGSDLAKSFQHFTLITAEERNVNSLPTGWMQIHYSDGGIRREEYNVTFFLGKNVDMKFLGQDAGVPLQIVCFTDRDRFSRLKAEFSAIIQSLSFPNGRLWLFNVSLYGSSNISCRSCGKNTGAKDACLFVKFPENEFWVSCAACRKAQPTTPQATAGPTAL
jgi:hypothetical protein